MRKLIFMIFISIITLFIFGCGSQNEHLSKGKEWVKSDKRGRIGRAVKQFELAIAQEPDNAEAHYLLGYYDENSTIERRAEQMVLAYKYDKKKYLKILIEEALRDRNEDVRKSAMKALVTIHSQMDPIIKPLVKILKSKDSRDRDNAALVLSQLSNYKEVVDRLVQKDIIKHKRMATRFDAVRALGDIGDPRAIDPLMERITALKTEDEKGEEAEVRRAAVVALRQIAKRDIEINDGNALLSIKVEPANDGVRISQDITGDLANKITLQNGEIISNVINNQKVISKENFQDYISQLIQNKSENLTLGIPKIVKVRISSIDDLGIVYDKLKSEPNGKGVIIDQLTFDSKAGKMGLESGEIISYINNKPVRTPEEYKNVINESISKNEELEFRVANDDKYKLINIAIPEYINDIGMTVESLPNGAEGVIVTALQPQSPAVEAGVRVGQIISFVVDNQKVTSPEQYRQLISSGLDDNKVTISVINMTAINKLIEVLRNKGLIVRFDAAIALGEIKAKSAVDSLIEMLGEQVNPIEIKL